MPRASVNTRSIPLPDNSNALFPLEAALRYLVELPLCERKRGGVAASITGFDRCSFAGGGPRFQLLGEEPNEAFDILALREAVANRPRMASSLYNPHLLVAQQSAVYVSGVFGRNDLVLGAVYQKHRTLYMLRVF